MGGLGGVCVMGSVWCEAYVQLIGSGDREVEMR